MAEEVTCCFRAPSSATVERDERALDNWSDLKLLEKESKEEQDANGGVLKGQGAAV